MKQLWFTLLVAAGLLPSAPAATIYVNNGYTGSVELGTATNPYKSVTNAESAAAAGDTLLITSGQYRETPMLTTPGALVANGGAVTIGTRLWGRLANPGFTGKPIKTTLFYAGRPLDGIGNTNDNGCGPIPNVTNIYSVYPQDPRHLNWEDLANPTSSSNRDFALQSMVDAGLNVVSMSSWGESWLPCVVSCPEVPAADCACQRFTCVSTVPRCFLIGTNQQCLVGWYGSANMQVTQVAKNQVFDAALGKPLLIIPFIESRFDYDWNFHDEFPYDVNGNLSPGLISQIIDLINLYLLHPANPQWPQQWARVYDQDGQERYAVAIVQVATYRLSQNDPNAHSSFANGFDAVAQYIYSSTGINVGFFIDPIAPDPTSTFTCTNNIILAETHSVYGSTFKPVPELTAPYLRLQKSILGIQCFSPEGWIDGNLGSGYTVNECYKLAWKQDFSQRWFSTGIPFLQDVTPGYDSTLLFANRDGGLKRWGYDDYWRNGLTQLVQNYGRAGMVYNAWNGYPEGLAAMPVFGTNGLPLPNGVTIDWLRSLTALYP